MKFRHHRLNCARVIGRFDRKGKKTLYIWRRTSVHSLAILGSRQEEFIGRNRERVTTRIARSGLAKSSTRTETTSERGIERRPIGMGQCQHARMPASPSLKDNMKTCDMRIVINGDSYINYCVCHCRELCRSIIVCKSCAK